MASVELLRCKQTSAEGRFTCTVNTLTEAIDDTNNEIDTIKSMYDDVNNAWKNVIEKHKDYISAADSEEVEPDSELWINEVQVRYYDICKVYNKKRFQYDNAYCEITLGDPDTLVMQFFYIFVAMQMK